MRKQNFSFFFKLCISIVKLLYFSFIYMVIKLTSFLYKMAFNSFYSAYLLRSNNYLLSTHSHWSPCMCYIFGMLISLSNKNFKSTFFYQTEFLREFVRICIRLTIIYYILSDFLTLLSFIIK